MYRGQAGLHDLKGQQVPLPPNVTRVYIAGGAWVNGGFVTTAPGTAVTISGRGVISGSAQPFLKDPAGLGPCHYNGSWCWSLVNMDRGEGHVLEGLVLHDPPKSAQHPIHNLLLGSALPGSTPMGLRYYFRSYAAGISVRGAKMLGAWTYNTDGVVTGAGGRVSDCFIQSVSPKRVALRGFG